MSNEVFLSADRFKNNEAEEDKKYRVEYEHIEFYFPDGFTPLRLIEECRALNHLDITEEDNFDFIYDITMQMLVGKIVFIYFKEDGKKTEIAKFLVTDRYMNLRSVPLIDSYPIVVNWLVEFISGYLGKKYPRSLKDIQAVMSENEEHTKSLKKNEPKVRASFPLK